MRTLLFILILPLKVGNCLGGQSYKNAGAWRETILDGSISTFATWDTCDIFF